MQTTDSAAAALSGAATGQAASATTGALATGAAATTTGAMPPAGGQTDAWFSGIQNQDVRTWVEAKGFKDPLSVAESAYNLEKMMGFDRAGRTLVMPGENATPEELKAFHAKIGVPETPDGYGLKLPEGQTDDSFMKQAAQWMHEAGIPAGSAQKLVEQWNGHMAAQQQELEQQFTAQALNDLKTWQAEQGAAYEQNLELAKRATQFLPEKLNAGGQEISRQEALDRIERAIGTGNMMRLFAQIGSGLSEHKVLQGDGGGILNPAQAQQKINELKSNREWTSAYLNGDKAKAKELSDLMALAYPAGG